MPISNSDKAKRRPNPSELPKRILKALVKNYDLDGRVRQDGMASSILAMEAGMNAQEEYLVSDLNEALKMLEKETYITINRDAYTVKPTYKGLEYARSLMRPWNKRAWDWLKGDVKTIVVAIITAVITAVITTWVLQLLGWK